MRRLRGIVLAGLALLVASSALAQTELDVSKIRLGTAVCVLQAGSGSPEGAVVGKVCDLYLRSDGSSFATVLYVKASGNGTNTGWVAASSGSGTVTSVGLALPTDVFDITNSPVTGSGTLTGAFDSQTAKYFFAAPNASAGTPSFRAMVASDVPTLNQDTTGSSVYWKAVATTGKASLAGPTAGTTRAKTVRDADDTLLELGGSYTPSGTWVWTTASVTWPTFNQNTTGSAAKWTTARTLAGNSVDGSANVAFSNKFIVQGTTDAGLSGAQFLGALGTGLLKNTTTTGVLSIAAAGDLPTHTHSGGDITSGLVGLTYGGTNANLSASTGGIVYSGASALAILSGTATAGKLLRSGASAAPTWSTATFPDTATTTGAYLRADGTNWITSTLVLPNAATANRVTYATGSNTLGESANLTFDGTTFTVSGNLSVSNVSNHLIPSATDTYDLGSASRIWRYGYLSQINALVFAKTTQTLFGGYSTIGKNAGAFAADVGSAATTINFGTTMTPGEWVLVRAHDTGGTIKAEYILVGTLVSGTTYNVTRDLAGAHGTDPAWAGGTPFLVLGANGDGRIDMIAYDGKPRIVWTTQGSAYNTQNDKAVIGNLNGYFGYSSDLYGAAIGDPTAAWIKIDPTNGVRLGHSSTTKVQIDASGNASFSGQLTSTSGTIGGWSIGASDLMAQSSTVGMSSGASYSFWAGNATPASAPFRVTPAGAVTATSGTVGGWTLGATTLTGGNATLTNTGNLTLGTTNSVVRLSADDATYRLWVGNATAASAPFRVTAAGAMTSTSGAIGGWTLGSTSLTAGSAGTTVGLDSGGSNPAIYAGSATPASAPFRVTNAGAVTATSGSIGGWTLGSTSLTAGSGATTVGVDSGGANPAFYAGSATPASAPFRVTNAGALTSTSGTIGGWTLGSTSLTSGSGSTTVGVDSGGSNPAFYAGSATPGSAPFRVTNAGALTATNATITGAITASSGSITGNLTIGSAGYLSQGKTSYSDSTAGFFLGSDSSVSKFHIGNAYQWMKWDGTNIEFSAPEVKIPQAYNDAKYFSFAPYSSKLLILDYYGDIGANDASLRVTQNLYADGTVYAGSMAASLDSTSVGIPSGKRWTFDSTSATLNGIIKGDSVEVTGDAKLGGAVVTSGVQASTASTRQDNFSLTSTTSILRVNPGATFHFTGFTGGVDGRRLMVCNVATSTYYVYFDDESSNSTSTNRIELSVTDTYINPVECMSFWYDGTSSRWRIAK